MKNILLLAATIFPICLFAQIGIKAGLNFANVTNASSINSSSQSGFHVGLLYGTPNKKLIGSRTELIYSRQGYNYETNTNTGNVNLDYILLPQYMVINITKFFQVQLGGQMAFLVNAKADSTNNNTGNENPYGEIMDYYNKFDFGLGGGVEVHPIKGLLVGARINIGLTSLYKDYTTPPSGGAPPSFIPQVDIKNNLFQLYAGWKFGK